MSKVHFDLSSGYNGISVDSFALVGPTLALTTDGWLINHVLLGLTLTPKVTDAEVVTAFKATAEKRDGSYIVHTSVQGYSHLIGEDLSEVLDPTSEHYPGDEDMKLITDADFRPEEHGFRVTGYPDVSVEEVEEAMDNEDELEFGDTVNRKFNWNWIEAIEPWDALDEYLNDDDDDDDEEGEGE